MDSVAASTLVRLCDMVGGKASTVLFWGELLINWLVLCLGLGNGLGNGLGANKGAIRTLVASVGITLGIGSTVAAATTGRHPLSMCPLIVFAVTHCAQSGHWTSPKKNF